jgi:cellulose synthase/poly-beta-1,6-N-acetylglucosamine synthase-like glycosyltransferase
MTYPYLHVGSAADVQGSDRLIYRALEILPGLLAWSTLIGIVVLSWKAPVAAAIFIILFDFYWLMKTIFLSAHLRASWKRMRHHLAIDWEERLRAMRWEHLQQLVIIPFFREERAIVEEAIENLLSTRWPKERMMVVLAAEEAAGKETANFARELKNRYEKQFGSFLLTVHPAGRAGEIPGKGANETWALHQSLRLIKDAALDPKDILVSSFDVDTRVPPHYFLCLAWHFLTAEKPHRSSFQPVPLYHNNIWQAPAISRVVAMSGTFWQMMQQERPERLTTFSSHSMSLPSLMDLGGWQTNIVSEDSRIFWNHYLFYEGDWCTVPLSYPVFMDANVGKNIWQTVKNVYRQQRRWGWGVENVPYALFGFIKQTAIPLRKRFYYAFNLLEGFWSWGTNAIFIFLLGWLPLFLGGEAFNQTILSYNLPRITRAIMTLAMVGLITSAVISIRLLRSADPSSARKKIDDPTRHSGSASPFIPIRKWSRWFLIALQWLLLPVTILLFGALPGLEAQTRLLLGGRWRPGFWFTPKHRLTHLERH